MSGVKSKKDPASKPTSKPFFTHQYLLTSPYDYLFVESPGLDGFPRAGEMAQLVKGLAAEPDDLTLVHRGTHMVKEEN